MLEICKIRQPFLVSALGMRRHPLECAEGVVVGDRERVLRREAVVYRHGDDVGSCNEGADEEVVGRAVGGADAEAAAVVVDDDRELISEVAGRSWEEEAGGDAGVGIDYDVFGDHAGGRVCGGGEDFGAAEALDEAALVGADEREVLKLEFSFGIHRLCDGGMR